VILFRHAYDLATHDKQVNSVCFNVSVRGQDHYGKPMSVSMGAVTFDSAQVAELRKYASADALANDGTNVLESFSNVFMFVSANGRSPYTKPPGLGEAAPAGCSCWQPHSSKLSSDPTWRFTAGRPMLSRMMVEASVTALFVIGYDIRNG
jgi:hypothetical protein